MFPFCPSELVGTVPQLTKGEDYSTEQWHSQTISRSQSCLAACLATQKEPWLQQLSSHSSPETGKSLIPVPTAVGVLHTCCSVLAMGALPTLQSKPFNVWSKTKMPAVASAARFLNNVSKLPKWCQLWACDQRWVESLSGEKHGQVTMASTFYLTLGLPAAGSKVSGIVLDMFRKAWFLHSFLVEWWLHLYQSDSGQGLEEGFSHCQDRKSPCWSSGCFSLTVSLCLGVSPSSQIGFWLDKLPGTSRYLFLVLSVFSLMNLSILSYITCSKYEYLLTCWLFSVEEAHTTCV